MNIIIFLVISIVLFFFIIFMFNKGIALRNYVKEAFSTMDVYLKKRWDLIPNLLSVVKGYSEHEKYVFENIAKLRNLNYSGMNENEKIDINSKLSSGLSKLIAVAENYPELKANQEFLQMMEELSSVENDIANARKYYNGTVRELNNYTEMFPTNIISNIFGFKSAKMYEIDSKERDNVKVVF